MFASPLSAHDDSEERHMRSLALSIGVVSLLALLTGFVVARVLTRSLRRLAEDVHDLQTRRLESLPLDDPPDEVGDVQRALRGLLLELEARENEIRDDRNRIAELAGQLEERIATKRRKLHEAQEVLDRVERMAAIGRAGTVISHELRNSLNAVSVAMDTLGTVDDEEAHRTARRLVRGEIARLRRLSEELIRFAREPVLQRREVPIADLVETARLLVVERAREPAVTIDVRCDGTPTANVDPDLLQTVLVNLLGNAVEAASNAEERRVLVEIAETPDENRVAFEDSGSG